MNRVEEILKIIQTEYVYLQEIDREVQIADKINELFEQRILEFTKWKDENYFYENGFYWDIVTSKNILKEDIAKTSEQLFNEWNNNLKSK